MDDEAFDDDNLPDDYFFVPIDDLPEYDDFDYYDFDRAARTSTRVTIEDDD